jgi:hypothetical protein
LGFRDKLLLGAFFGALFAAPADATMVTLSYAGNVTFASGSGTPQAGETFTGTLTFDDATLDGDADVSHGSYSGAVILNSITFSGGTSHVQTFVNDIDIRNDFGGFDRWRADGANATAVWALDLIDFGQDALASDALLPPSLALFDTPTIFFAEGLDSSEGVVTSLILAVPEPSTLLLIAVGVAVLGRRRSAR